MNRCFFCGKQVDPDHRTTYRRVIGWHRPGKAGGSDISLRELRDEWACTPCIVLEKSSKRSRVDSRQETLL